MTNGFQLWDTAEVMKRTFLSVGLVLIIGLFGCTPPSVSPPMTIESSPLIGTWTIPASESIPTESIQFFEDGRFIIASGVSNNVMAEGMYNVTGNELMLQYGGESASGDCTFAAAYTFTIDGETVHFERLLDDLCGSRVEQFNKIWSLQE